MSSPISFQGLATNLPTDELVSAIIAQESQPMLAMQAQQATNTQKVSALNNLSSDLSSLSSAMSTLSTTGFAGNTVTSSDSGNTYVSATANGAVAGQYDVTVKSLATRARLVLSNAVQPSAQIGTGTYAITDMAGNTVNVTINSSNNSLTGLADAINAATDQNGNPSDVTAAVIQTGTDGTSQLVLSAANTGTGASGATTFSFAPASGSVLGGSTAAQDAFTGTGASLTLSQTLASPTALVGAGTYVVTDNAGNTANISLSGTSTLTDLMNAINSPTASTTGGALNLTASIQTGANGSQLVLTPNSGSGSYGITVASGSALEVPASSGTLTSTAATNADFILNGVELHRTSNSVGDAVQGVTFNLNQAQTDLTQPTTLTVAQDQNAATSAMQAVITAYNKFYKDYQANNTFTQNSDGTYTTGVFNMDMTIRNIVTEVQNSILGTATGLPSTDAYSNPADVGISINIDGSLSLNTATFQSALSASPTSVANLFANSGTSTNSLLTYVSSGASTTNNPIAYSVASNPDGSLTATMTVGSDAPITLQSSNGYFVGTPGTSLAGLTFQASAGAVGTLNISTGLSSTLQSLITSLTDSNPGDIGGLITNLNQDNANLQINIDQQQNYLATSKASLEQVYSNLESTVGQLQAAGQSLSSL